MTIASPLELKFGVLTWIESSKQGDSAWYSHWRQHRLRARPLSPTRWIVSYETPAGWIMIASGVTMGEVSAQAEEWVSK